MKTLSFYSLFSLLLSLTSCDINDDSTPTALKGNWTLVKVSGTIAGIENNYPSGKIKWFFGSSKVTVTNTDTEHDYDVFESGKYNYYLKSSEIGADCTETININKTDMGCYYVNGNELYITQLASDGVLLKLVKM